VEQELQECFSSREGFLYNLLRYHMGWVDQQGQPENTSARESFHSLIAPAVCEAITDQIEPSLPVAAAVDLLYSFSVVHGDVQAGRLDAGSRPSIWWVWGPAQAINAGDGFHAMARVAVMRLLGQGVPADKVLEAAGMLDRSCLSMCEGQFTDLGFQDRMLVTIGEYEDMISRKTGALTGFAAAGGALAAGTDAALQMRMRDLGVKLGMAWQITRDIEDFWGQGRDGVTASNVLNKKKSLPLIYTLENCCTSAKREIGTVYMKRVLEAGDLSRVIEIMDETGARNYSEARASNLVDEGMHILESEPISGDRQTGLRALAQQALSPSTQVFNT
jgi:geranylgeranyl diphosphate synthase type I